MKRACVSLLAFALCVAAPLARAQDSAAPSRPEQVPAAPHGEHATGQDGCVAPDTLTHVEAKLARTAIAAKQGKLKILVLGTGSSTLAGPQGAQNAYPARLQAALAARLAGVEVTVATDVKVRRTAAEMAAAIRQIPADKLPGLVVWQTGTVDAIRGVDPDDFRAAMEEGVKKLRTAGVDVVLMNMQYSPRTEIMVKAGPYAEAMRWVAQQLEVPLFDRLSVMNYWSENGVFDFSGSDRNQLAERVHDCIGRLLAELIVDSAGLKKKAKID